jgi:hypothetical protein
MSKAGKITVSVEASRNQETITVTTTGIAGGIPVNTIRSRVTYSSRSSTASPEIYWDAILTRAMTQLS